MSVTGCASNVVRKSSDCDKKYDKLKKEYNETVDDLYTCIDQEEKCYKILKDAKLATEVNTDLLEKWSKKQDKKKWKWFGIGIGIGAGTVAILGILINLVPKK